MASNNSLEILETNPVPNLSGTPPDSSGTHLKFSGLSKSFSFRKKASGLTVKRSKTMSAAPNDSDPNSPKLDPSNTSKEVLQDDTEMETFNPLQFKHTAYPLEERFYSYRPCNSKDWSTKNLSILVLNNNDLDVFPTCICNLENLRYLCLSANQLAELSPQLIELQNLQILILNSNVLTSEGINCVSFEKMKSLKSLFIVKNCIESFPKSLLNSEIETLALSQNQIQEIPNEIENMKHLLWLGLSLTIANNPLNDLDPKVKQRASRQFPLAILYQNNNPNEAMTPPEEYMSPIVLQDALVELKKIKENEMKRASSPSLAI
ncbi:hypothetical protein HMI55_005556 [Coelomomyces lativittatus]|nr:hypothetical protein HMI55_005556 [Coelomomyces lativittatus]